MAGGATPASATLFICLSRVGVATAGGCLRNDCGAAATGSANLSLPRGGLFFFSALSEIITPSGGLRASEYARASIRRGSCEQGGRWAALAPAAWQAERSAPHCGEGKKAGGWQEEAGRRQAWQAGRAGAPTMAQGRRGGGILALPDSPSCGNAAPWEGRRPPLPARLPHAARRLAPPQTPLWHGNGDLGAGARRASGRASCRLP